MNLRKALQLNVSKKIILIPTVATIVLLSILTTTLIVQSENQEHTTRIEYGYFPALGLVRDLDRLLENLQRNLQDAVAAEDVSALAASDEQRDTFIQLIAANEGYVLLGAEAEFEELQQQFNDYYTVARSTTQMMIQGEYGERLTTGLESMRESYVAIKSELDTAKQRWGIEMEEAFEMARDSSARAQTIFNIIAVGTVIAICILAALTFFVLRSILPALRSAVHIADSIAADKLDNEIVVIANDELGDLLQALGRMQGNLRDRTEADKEQLAITSRIKQALDGVNGNVMIGDPDLNIIYMNDAVNTLFHEAEADIRKDLPNFDADGLIGSCIDDLFAKKPTHQRGMLANLSSTHTAELVLGGLTFQVIANPVLGADGERLGTVVEWTDRTQELAIESEVQHVVDCALAGDLTNRISLDDKDGFFERLSCGVNELVGVAEKVIGDTVRVLSAMAAGTLTETIEADYQGSFQQLKDDANATVDKLTEVVGNIQSGASAVKTGADEISQGNANLSQRTEQQATSLEETASSMEEMTSTVKQNADNAGEANQLAMAAREQAEKGGAVVKKAVEAMNEINASSRKISDIIGVIDEIAFQTNLLALNASVEAARAGDQGRGFAVVASEVRNLAGRSATAAKEIKELIEDSGAKVEEGSRLVNDSGETLEEIVSGVKKVTDIVGEIAAASQEQSAGIDEVNKAIVQLDELTQQNAALVEQASAASQAMGEQADDLNEMMAFFTVDHSDQPDATASSGPAAERRAGNRPWRGSETTAKSGAQVAAPPRKAAASGGDQEWEEF